MNPFVVLKNLSPELVDRWNKCFVRTGRSFSLGMWFRTQEESNKNFSNWKNANDKRRRLIQFYDEYAIVNNDFCIVNSYLWLSLAFPKNEINLYKDKIDESLQKGNWIRNDAGVYEKDNFNFSYKETEKLEEDCKNNREFPEDYSFLTITFKSKSFEIPEDVINLPWKLFNQGIRKPEKRENPTYTDDLSVIKEYLPAQIELGCGPSIEAGVDPLYSYHNLYSVQDHVTKKFFLSPEDDQILYELLTDTNKYFADVSEMYRKILLAKPTKFHYCLKAMMDKGLLVGPILNNDFDGLCEQLDMETIFIRDYLKYFRFKEYDFNPKAKSYIVIGCHSDRRMLQGLARKKGLKVIHIDPECFLENGEYRAYPLEGPKDNDIVLNLKGMELAEKCSDVFGI